MTANRDPHWWSWKDIVQNADRLGIPHFQRGAVWDITNRVALLESLYEQSPCGSLVLWSPEDSADPFRHGVPLRRFDNAREPIWLVDGQQRTRALLDIFDELLPLPTEEPVWNLVSRADLDLLRGFRKSMPDPVADLDEVASFWGVVFPSMQVFDENGGAFFKELSESRNVVRSSMFRFLKPRASIHRRPDGGGTNVPPLTPGVIPLAALISAACVFLDRERLPVFKSLLETFATGTPSFQQLDDLAPWGPQFVTGYAFKAPANHAGLPLPHGWADLHARRHEKSVKFMVERLIGLCEKKWKKVFERFSGMLNGNRFAAGWLPSGDISAAIEAYVRINRAGIRVRNEERALALLTRAYPAVLNDLAEFIRLRDGANSVEDKRSLLTHESDRQLGFEFWISTVTRYANLALLGTLGRKWLGVAGIDKQTFGYRLHRVGPKETDTGKTTWARPGYSSPEDLMQESAKRATRALLLLDSILSEELHLDHRMARPSMRALAPLIDILYQLPATLLEQLRNDRAFRVATGRLLHWTLLAPYIDQAKLEELVLEALGIDERDPDVINGKPLPLWDLDGEGWQQKLRAAFVRYQKTLARIWPQQHADVAVMPVFEQLNQLAEKRFAEDVGAARSLQHPAVGWLYAIERRGKAREFSWQAQYDGYRTTDQKAGMPKPKEGADRIEEPLGSADGLNRDLYPEKQHIVPFVVATRIPGNRGTRSTASDANAIGNLTWLSHRQNCLAGLADRWTVMDQTKDGGNLRARGMLAKAPVEDVAALELYQKIQILVADASWHQDQECEPVKTIFASFRSARREWMVVQMREWLAEPLSQEAQKWLR
jgi:hypothetical protein